MATKEIKVPDLGNVANAAIIEVAVKVDDIIQMDDTLITLESDKASMDIPASSAGKVKEIKVKIGDKVSTGDVIVIVEAESAEITQEKPIEKPIEKPEEKLVGVQHAVPVTKPPVALQQTINTENTDEEDDEGDVHAGPGVRRLAREFAVDLNKLQGTGPKGRILKEDLQNYVKNQMANGGGSSGLPAAPVVDFKQFGEIESKPLSRIKKLTAVNLHRNWFLVPHVTQFEEADITEMESFRKSQQVVLINKASS